MRAVAAPVAVSRGPAVRDLLTSYGIPAGPVQLEASGLWEQDRLEGHFLLLPDMLKRRRADLRVGFFLHIPFPSYEIFRMLPDRWRSALLEGMLGADLI